MNLETKIYLNPKNKVDAYLYIILGILLLLFIFGIIFIIIGLIKLTKKTTYNFVNKGIKTSNTILKIFSNTKIDGFNNIKEYDISTKDSVISKLFKNNYTTVNVIYEILKGSNLNAIIIKEKYTYYIETNLVDDFLNDIENLYERVKNSNDQKL